MPNKGDNRRNENDQHSYFEYDELDLEDTMADRDERVRMAAFLHTISFPAERDVCFELRASFFYAPAGGRLCWMLRGKTCEPQPYGHHENNIAIEV